MSSQYSRSGFRSEMAGSHVVSEECMSMRESASMFSAYQGWESTAHGKDVTIYVRSGDTLCKSETAPHSESQLLAAALNAGKAGTSVEDKTSVAQDVHGNKQVLDAAYAEPEPGSRSPRHALSPSNVRFNLARKQSGVQIWPGDDAADQRVDGRGKEDALEEVPYVSAVLQTASQTISRPCGIDLHAQDQTLPDRSSEKSRSCTWPTMSNFTQDAMCGDHATHYNTVLVAEDQVCSPSAFSAHAQQSLKTATACKQGGSTGNWQDSRDGSGGDMRNSMEAWKGVHRDSDMSAGDHVSKSGNNGEVAPDKAVMSGTHHIRTWKPAITCETEVQEEARAFSDVKIINDREAHDTYEASIQPGCTESIVRE